MWVVFGLFNIVGSLHMGRGAGRWRMKSLLSPVYAARAVGVTMFLVAPKTAEVMLIFAAVMGLTYLPTVPPTAGWQLNALASATWPPCSP